MLSKNLRLFFFLIITAIFFSNVNCTRLPQRIYYFTIHGNEYKNKVSNINEDTTSFIQELNTKSDFKFRDNNFIKVIATGDSVLQRMYDLINAAETEVLIDQYIFRDDEIGKKFFELLQNKAKDGVKVRVIIDKIGSLKPSLYFSKKIKYSKVKIRYYNPVLWWSIIKINNRDHNKVLIIDDDTAIISGIGLGQEYKYWRDLGVEINGPIIYDLKYIFELNWRAAGYGWFGKDIPFPFINELKLNVDELFLKDIKIDTDTLTLSKGDITARALYGSPKFTNRAIFESILTAVNSAQKNIYITNAYFLPNVIFRKALYSAVKRGVDVRIITPQKSDLPLMRRYTQIYYNSMLKNGIKIYELRDRVLHAKYMVIDDVWSTIGSININDRSFFMNIEQNIEIIDKKINAQLTQIFLDDMNNSEEIILEHWQKRSILKKIRDIFMLPSILLY